ncbi:hypothetical protein BH11PLA2_BH11PLA2_10480 [soil metagenome]
MRIPIRLPDLGDSAVKFSLWAVRPGDDVREGERVAEVTIPGLVLDIVAPAAGLLAERFVNAGETLNAGHLLGNIETGNNP